MTENKIVELLEKIDKKLEILTKKEDLPQLSEQKVLSFLFDVINTNWTSFKPIQPRNIRSFAYYYNSAPPVLTELEEGWIPLRLSNNSELHTKDNDLLTKNTEIDAVLDTIKTVVDAIKAQTDKLTFSDGTILHVHETAPA